MSYYRAFAEKYCGVTDWHQTLLDTAVREKRIRIPSGREYAFPHCERKPWGVSFATQIKNYGVQGFATADIVPCAFIAIWRELKARGLRSVLVNTVHDSIVVDVHPDEKEIVKDLLVQQMAGVVNELKRRYNYDMKMPLGVEIKAGPNWLDTKVVAEVWMAS